MMVKSEQSHTLKNKTQKNPVPELAIKFQILTQVIDYQKRYRIPDSYLSQFANIPIQTIHSYLDMGQELTDLVPKDLLVYFKLLLAVTIYSSNSARPLKHLQASSDA